MKNARQYRRQFDKEYTGIKTPVENSISKTQPDLSMTIQQLMKNHTRGINSDVIQREPQYHDDLEIPTITDLTDIVYAKEELNEREEELKQQIATEKNAAKAAKEAKIEPKPQKVVIVSQEYKPDSKPEKPQT